MIRRDEIIISEQVGNLFLFTAIAGAAPAILDLALFVILDIPVAYFILGGDAYRKFRDIQMPLATRNEMRCRYTKIDETWYAFEEIEE